MIDSLNLLDGDIQRGKRFGTEGYIADKHFACLRKLHVFPGRKPRERDKFNSALNYLSGCFSMAQHVLPQLRARPYSLWLPEPSG